MAHTLAVREWVTGLLARCPSDCPLCRSRANGGLLCPACTHELGRAMQAAVPRCPCCCLVLDAKGICHDCSRIAPAYDRIIAAFDYAFPGNLLIHQFKQQRRFVSAKMLSALLWHQIRLAQFGLANDTILLPVPASRASLKLRGFNPAGELARSLGRRLGLRCRTDVLFRHRETGQQKYLGRQQRASALVGLYGCHGSVSGWRVALVDDVMTTGSTLNSLAVLLKEAGAVSVCGLVLARTPLRERAN